MGFAERCIIKALLTPGVATEGALAGSKFGMNLRLDDYLTRFSMGNVLFGEDASSCISMTLWCRIECVLRWGPLHKGWLYDPASHALVATISLP